MFLFFVRVRHTYVGERKENEIVKEKKKKKGTLRHTREREERRERKKEPMNRGRRRSVVGWLRNNLVRRFVASLTG